MPDKDLEIVNCLNILPSVSGTPMEDQVNETSDVANVPTAQAFDAGNGPNPTYTATGLPSGAEIHPITGIINGTLDTVQVVTTEVTLTTDYGAISDSFTWTVTTPGPVDLWDAVDAGDDAWGLADGVGRWKLAG